MTDVPSFPEVRLRTIAPRLGRQLERLYGAAAAGLWPRVEAVLRARSADRPAALRALDEARVADPDWFVAPDMIGYSTYVDRYAGTVRGMAERVDHLEALGVRYLHVLALLKARDGDSDGGFAVADYLAVEPRLGSMADVEALAERLRARRISLCVDLALNHTADDHEWAKAARAGDPHYRAFYHVVDDATAAAYEADLGQVFPTTAPGNFTAVPAMGGNVWTTFYPFQWDLNWANPDVMLAMIDTMLRLANHGFEAFRLDSTAFLWKQAGTDCRNLPQAHYIVRALRAALDIAAPATLLKAEAIVPTAFVPPYFGADDGAGFEPECHLVYNNSLMVAGWVALAEGSASLPDAIVRASGGLPRGANWLSYARCHDDIGWGTVMADLAGIDPDPVARLTAAAHFTNGEGSWSRGEAFQSDGSVVHGTNGTLAALAGLETAGEDPEKREMALRRIALLNALAIASGGLATTYMGDEAGLLNDYSYRDDPERKHEGRWLHRPTMDWHALGSDAAKRISADLVSLRNARVAAGGAGEPAAFETGSVAVLGIRCGTDSVFMNFSGHVVTIAMPSPTTDRLTGCTLDPCVRLEAVGHRVDRSRSMSAQLFGCIEAGGTKFVLGVMRDHQTVLEETRIPTTAPAETLRACVEFFKDATRRNGRLNAVGIASFGPLGVRPHERGWGTIIRSPKTAWSGTDIVTPFKSAFNCPIGLDTDVNAAVLAESLWGSAQRKDVATYVTVGTGIGGGVLINGKIVHGTRHPEMGHMIPRRHPADGDFAGVCRFHNDCLEGLASGPAIQRRWGATLSELGHNHPAQRIIAFYLAQLVVAQRALLAPQRIVFGGGVMASPGLLSRIRTEATLLERRYFSEEAASDLVVTSELGARTGLLGALALAQTASR